jgi:hypothetical protein
VEKDDARKAMFVLGAAGYVVAAEGAGVAEV